MNEIVIGMIAAGSATAAGAGVWLGWALCQYRSSEVSPDEVQALSPRKYAVLERLASPEDLEFLRSLPGFSPEVEKKFLRERRQTFRSYLREMAADFNLIHRTARELVATAPEEHSDMVAVLFSQQITFWRSLLIVEARLALSWSGVPAVDLSSLTKSFEVSHGALASANSFA